MKIYFTLVLVAALSAFPQISSAKLLLQESFDTYREGEIKGQPSGTPGLAGNWNGEGVAVISSEGYSEISKNLLEIAPSGKWTFIKFDFDSEDSPFKDQTGLLGEDPGSRVFISFKVKLQSSVAKDAQMLISFPEQIGSNKGVAVGQIWGSPFFGIAQGQPSKVSLDEELHTFFIEVTRGGGDSMSAKFYIDPATPSRLPLSAQKPAAIGWPKDKNMKLIALKANGNSFSIDNLRIGTTAESVLN
ncbi:MAG: hypothetical protein AAF558_01625 [Verrucomicrobiota bacterium]